MHTHFLSLIDFYSFYMLNTFMNLQKTSQDLTASKFCYIILFFLVLFFCLVVV